LFAVVVVVPAGLGERNEKSALVGATMLARRDGRRAAMAEARAAGVVVVARAVTATARARDAGAAADAEIAAAGWVRCIVGVWVRGRARGSREVGARGAGKGHSRWLLRPMRPRSRDYVKIRVTVDAWDEWIWRGCGGLASRDDEATKVVRWLVVERALSP